MDTADGDEGESARDARSESATVAQPVVLPCAPGFLLVAHIPMTHVRPVPDVSRILAFDLMTFEIQP